MTYRSMLFVPGARPDRFAKAAASGADAVCIDLEDAVAPDRKASARIETLAYFKSGAPAGVGLRVNALKSIEGLRDVVALAESGARPAFIMIPKVAGAAEVLQLRAVLGAGAPPIWPLMETPESFFAILEIARATGEAGGIMFGGADFSSSIGADMSFDALHAARSAIVAAAALAGCATMDVPFLDLKDEAGLRTETVRVRGLGFLGRAAIHPAQIAIINEVFTPSAEEISKAERIAAAYEAAAGGAALLEGKLIEKPILKAAERALRARGK